MDHALAVVTEVCNGSGCRNVDVNGETIAKILAIVGGFIGIIVIIAILAFAFWVWMLVDAVSRDEASYAKVNVGEKTLWILVLSLSFLFGLYFLAAILYYFIVRKKAKNLETAKKATKKKT